MHRAHLRQLATGKRITVMVREAMVAYLADELSAKPKANEAASG
ncbi:MAG: hypothetical protein AAB263_00055 [Planctomycetota bacterium]